jgi:hypothetical protein
VVSASAMASAANLDFRVQFLNKVGRVVKGDGHMGRPQQAAAIVDHRPHHRFLAQAVGQHQFGVDAVLPADHIKALFVKSLDGRRNQRQGIGLDGNKNDVGLVVGQVIDAGAGVADRLGQVFGAFDDDSPFQGRFKQIGNHVTQDHSMAPFGQKCRHDAAHGARTDNGKGFGDKGWVVCHGGTSHCSGGCVGRSVYG